MNDSSPMEALTATESGEDLLCAKVKDMVQFIGRAILAVAGLLVIGVLPISAQQTLYPPRVSLEEVRHRIDDCPKDHPRVLATRSELLELARSLDREPFRRQVADLIIREAKALQRAEPVRRTLEGRRLLSESRRCLERVLVLSMAYYLTGDVQHVQRCRQEMLAAARFSDWNPSHFLDVAEMTCSLAIGYDWLYEQLDEGTRSELRAAIVQKGVRLAFDAKYSGWTRLSNNWGQVCHGGLTIGALAVLEDEPGLAARTVHNALENVVPAMNQYAPRGNYPEGPNYWSYGTTYNVLLIDTLNHVFGSDFGLSKAPGFDQTGAYPALVCGPSGLYFNYADSGPERRPEPVLFWFATHYRRPDWLWRENELWQKQLSNSEVARTESYRFLPLALLWTNKTTDTAETRLPLHWNGGGKVPIAIHRSSWSDPGATYIGLKGGSPATSHGQMDIGSFVLDSDGVRWAVDLGRENYNAIESRSMNLWSNKQDSDRWTIFRLNNLGHNTLVINDQLQVAAGDAPIVRFSDDPARPNSILDMSQVYKGQADSVRRGVALLPTREVLLQDEISGLKPGSRVRWGMITPAKPETLGESQILLRQAGKQLKLTLIASNDCKWTEIDTSSPRRDWDSPNPETRMVAIEARAPQSGELTIAVLATPGTCDDSAANNLRIAHLDSWHSQP